mgnify:CR=1 FL=1
MGRSIFESLQQGVPAASQNGVTQFVSAMQQVNQIMRGAPNPAMLAKQYFPDIPDEYLNNPEQVLAYIQQSRGIDSNAIQQLRQMMGVR